jgi:hypothetical protein
MGSQNSFVAQGPYDDGVKGVGGDAGGTGVVGQGGEGRSGVVGGIGVLGVGGNSEGVGFGPGVVGIDGKAQVRLRRYLDAPEVADRQQTADIGVFGLGRTGVVGVDEGHNPPDFIKRDQVGVFGVGNIGVSGSGDLNGVFGQSEGDGDGVRGVSNRGTGVWGESQEDNGVFGHSTGGDGVSGRTNGEGRSGVFGHNTRSGNGVYGSSDSPHGTGVWGEGLQGNGVVGKTQGLDRCGVYGENTAVLEQPTPKRGGEHPLIEPAQTLRETQAFGVQGVSTHGVGVNGVSSYDDGMVGEANSRARSGVYGLNLYSGDPHSLDQADRTSYGVTGHADDFYGIGVRGMSKHGYGATLQGGQAPLRLLPAETAGKPASGQVGELFVDSHGDLYFCKVTGSQVTGSPPTWKKIA